LNDSSVFDKMLSAWYADAATSTTACTSFDLGTLAQMNGGATSGAPSATALRKRVLERLSTALRTPPSAPHFTQLIVIKIKVTQK
jgi:hypothetical protein